MRTLRAGRGADPAPARGARRAEEGRGGAGRRRGLRGRGPGARCRGALRRRRRAEVRRRRLGARKGGARGRAHCKAPGHVRADLRALIHLRRPAAGLQVHGRRARRGVLFGLPGPAAARVLRARRRGARHGAA